MRTEASGGRQAVDGVMSAARNFDIRAYRVTNANLIGKTNGEIEALPKDVRAFILRVRRAEAIIEFSHEFVIRENDVVAVAARYEVRAESGNKIGPEVSDRVLLDMLIEAVDVVVTNRLFEGKSLGALAQATFARAVFLSRLTRSGIALPLSPETRIDRGDVIRLLGTVPQVALASEALGYADRPTSRHISGRSCRAFVARCLGRAPYPNGERRRAGHGSRVWMATLGLPIIRSHS